MNRAKRQVRESARLGLIEIMVGILISMLMVLIIYQVYLVSEGQKRTITAGSDAQQNASYGLFLIGQDLMGAGQVISASMTRIERLRDAAPDPRRDRGGRDRRTIRIRSPFFYGGSSSLSTPTPLLSPASVGTSPPGAYVVAGPLAFSPNDVIVAVQGANCTLSTINAAGVVRRGAHRHRDDQSHADGDARQQHDGDLRRRRGIARQSGPGATPGEAARFGQTLYSVDAGTHTLRTQSLLPTAQAVTPVVSNVINLKAQFGLDTNNDGDGGHVAAGDRQLVGGEPAAAAARPRGSRSARCESRSSRAATSTKPMPSRRGRSSMFCTTIPCAVSMTLDAEAQHYRYKVLETTIPFRNALWNAP